MDIAIQILPYIFIAALSAGLGVFLYRKVQNYFRVKRMRRGQEMEKKAFKVLEKKGYKIVDYQPVLHTEIILDSVPKRFKITPDFKVKKGGREYYVEVKSGHSATDIGSASTRRQILEYALASNQPEMLLLNMETEMISSVQFSQLSKRSDWKIRVWRFLAILMFLGYLIMLFVMASQGLLQSL